MALTAQKTMVIGGAASGKSSFAEAFVIAREPGRLVYLATAQAFDAEMEEKIAAHRRERAAAGWHTIEEPLDIAAPLSELQEGDAVLLDCATMWLNNTLACRNEMHAEIDRFCEAVTACPAPVCVVSNEVGQGIVPENALARRFRNLQGNLNYSLAQRCDLVVQVVAGLPNVLKGALP